jgi:hypothetical protein
MSARPVKMVCGILTGAAGSDEKNPGPACGSRDFYAGAVAGIRSNILDVTTLFPFSLIHELPDLVLVILPQTASRS